MLGNFIADMVKGRQIDNFNQGIVDGILLHRKIDAFTDTHPVVEQSKMRLRNKYRLYSAVVVDMFYDHFLARNWSNYSSLPLNQFVKHAYNILLRNYFMLPVRARYMLPFMVSANWLVSYSNLESLQQVFEGMARRTPFDSGMENAVFDLVAFYKEFEEEFHSFFPELILFVGKQGISHQHHQNE